MDGLHVREVEVERNIYMIYIWLKVMDMIRTLNNFHCL